jgi:hypothetical protein
MSDLPAKPRHKFPKGVQSNPRPKGRAPKVTSVDELVVTAAPAVLEKTIAAALAGDMAAAAIVLGMKRGTFR